MISPFSSLFVKSEKPTSPIPNFPYTLDTNPYKCKRTWPPEFESLSKKHQFSLEKRYRRRMKLKWARPTWNKGTKLAQWGSILAVAVYGVVYMDLGKLPNLT